MHFLWPVSRRGPCQPKWGEHGRDALLMRRRAGQPALHRYFIAFLRLHTILISYNFHIRRSLYPSCLYIHPVSTQYPPSIQRLRLPRCSTGPQPNTLPRAGGSTLRYLDLSHLTRLDFGVMHAPNLCQTTGKKENPKVYCNPRGTSSLRSTALRSCIWQIEDFEPSTFDEVPWPLAKIIYDRLLDT